MPSRKNKRERLAGEIAQFVQEVGRQAQKGVEPNDLHHDRKLESKLKRMSPLEIDALMRFEGDD